MFARSCECEIKTTNRNKELNFLAKSQPLGPALNALDPAAQRWRRMSMAVNSGACKTVANPDELPNYEVFETPSSRAGEGFTGAPSDAIPNLAGMQVPIMTREGTQRLLAVTAAPVTKSLLAVDQLNASGHVVFDQDNSFIFNKFSGELNALRKENGNFVLDVWVPPNNSQPKAPFHRQP